MFICVLLTKTHIFQYSQSCTEPTEQRITVRSWTGAEHLSCEPARADLSRGSARIEDPDDLDSHPTLCFFRTRKTQSGEAGGWCAT